MCLWAVLDDRKLLTVLDDTDPSCSGWDGLCGGCTSCLFAQADYSDCLVIPVPLDDTRHETFEDALSTLLDGRVPPGHLPAMQTCLERHWPLGQLLASAKWSTPRKLDGAMWPNARLAKVLPMQSVRVLVNEDGSVRKDYLYTFPEDVHPIETDHATSSVA